MSSLPVRFTIIITLFWTCHSWCSVGWGLLCVDQGLSAPERREKVRIRCISHLNDCCIGHTKVRTETLTESTVIVGQKRQRKGGRCHCCSKIAWKYMFIVCSLEMWGLRNNFSWLNISQKPKISQIRSLAIVDLLSPGTGREWQRAQWARQLWRGWRCTS